MIEYARFGAAQGRANTQMHGEDAGVRMSTIPYVSIVIPAYNEAQRLPGTLDTVLRYLGTQPFNMEVIVVDDGSKDDTAAIAEEYIPEGRGYVLREPHKGKAAAVLAGMLAAQGEYVIFMDADLAVPVEDIHLLLPYLKGEYSVAIGSREGSGSSRKGEPLLRHVMGRVYNTIVQLLVVPGIKDTQCGFKMFRADAVAEIFPRLQLYGLDSPVIAGARVTGFDVEVLFLARRRGCKIREVPVHWSYGEDSKVSPLKDSILLFLDVLKVRANDLRGLYK